MFILNPQSGIPIYRQLVEQVRRMVTSSQLSPGDSLPSIRDLAQQHAINPMTISKAYSMLEAEGLLQRNRGKPMTVAKHQLTQSPIQQRLKQIEPQVQQLVLAAKQLELTPAKLTQLLNTYWEDQDV